MVSQHLASSHASMLTEPLKNASSPPNHWMYGSDRMLQRCTHESRRLLY